ncbi:hypothetical protein VB773_10505 [Haloarculaceae archaeon H-GB2-1]|nr:hypothetical protein [Haloarculaceae archaeon H-GB1-1]MEA5407947.1 hypothetical protein [Haloarculaceae archaeon H-GB2-1]
MSVLQKYLKGFGLRSSTPSFDSGQEVSVFLTGYGGSDGAGLARVGDTTLRIPDAPVGKEGARVRIRVESFDDSKHVGEATYLETVSEGSAF